MIAATSTASSESKKSRNHSASSALDGRISAASSSERRDALVPRPRSRARSCVPTLDACCLKIAVRVTLSRFTASLWIAVRERSL
jgi:hypothetical protein